MATINKPEFPVPEQISCTHCFKPIIVFDPAGSEYIVCNSCNFYLHKLKADHIVSVELVPKAKKQPLISIGATGILNAITYKVIAYMEKKESGTHYEWCEYMLYNNEKGYAFLSEYEGHWTYIAGEMHYPELNKVLDGGDYATCNDIEYALFNKYTPVITGILGEFDWNVYDERIKATEFINPPFLLVKELNNRTHLTDFYLGEYYEAETIAKSFNLDTESFPEKIGIGANEPSRFSQKWDTVLKWSIIFAIVVLLLQLCVVYLRPEKILLDNSFSLYLHQQEKKLRADSNALLKGDSINQVANNYLNDVSGNYEMNPFRTPTFTVSNGPAPLEFEISSPVDNNWFEASIELVNEKDNQTWNVNKEVEYYHGIEDGESWSEGETVETVLISGIPEGKYHLNIYPFSGSRLLSGVNIKVTENVTLWRNVLVTIALLSLYPVYVWYRRRNFETKRWMNSDYSPYDEEEEE